MVSLSVDKAKKAIKDKILAGTVDPQKEKKNEVSSIRSGGRQPKADKNPLPLVFRDGIFQYRRDDIYEFTNTGIFRKA